MKKGMIMNDPVFVHTREQLQQIASDVLRYAKERGASSAAVGVSDGNGLTVSVRKGKVETIERNQDKAVGATLYIGQRRGNATSSDFSEKSLRAMVDAAYDIASFTTEDASAGLPDADMLEMNPPDLGLYFPWQITADEAADIAMRCEGAAFEVDKRIANSEGAEVTLQHFHFISADSQGFMGGYPYSSHAISVAPIAGKGTGMERDYWYTASRHPGRLDSPESVGKKAAQRALARLGARRIGTRQCPVLFEAPAALGLMGAFVHAVSGGALYRRTSFLLDSLGKPVFPAHIGLREDPRIPGATGSAPFDDEGVRTAAREVVAGGIVQGYFLSSYSARRLGMKTTGNAGGAHNLFLTSSKTDPADDFAAMLKKMDTGLVVTELMGQGVNYVTGDYSRGASGFWVEQGVIQYPVQEITIAGNLKEMFAQMVAVGADRISRGGRESGSVLIENMTVAGN